MQIEHGLLCNNCQALDIVVGKDQSRTECRMCGSHNVLNYELPPKPSRKRHEEAYRARAGEVGILLSCICTYPLDTNESTVSGHDPRCPSEAMTKARIEREEMRAAQEQDVKGPIVPLGEKKMKCVDTMKVREREPKLEDDERPPWER